jgi:hypothetical protein
MSVLTRDLPIARQDLSRMSFAIDAEDLCLDSSSRVTDQKRLLEVSVAILGMAGLGP